MPWPQSYFSSLPQCPVLTSASHWFSPMPFPQLRPLHTQFPPSRWRLSLPVPWLTFPLTGCSLNMPPGDPFPDHQPCGSSAAVFVSPTRGTAPVRSLVCLHALVCLPLQTAHPTLAFLVVSPTRHGAWDVVGPEYLCLVVTLSSRAVGTRCSYFKTVCLCYPHLQEKQMH